MEVVFIFKNILISLAITILIIFIVDYIKFRLHNLTINKINKTIIQGFSVFFLEETLNKETLENFSLFINQKLSGFGLNKRMSNFKVKHVSENIVEIGYSYLLSETKKNEVSYQIRKKDL